MAGRPVPILEPVIAPTIAALFHDTNSLLFKDASWVCCAIPCTQQLQSRGASGVQTSGVAAPVANLRMQFKTEVSSCQMETALEKARAGVVTGPLPGHIYLLDALNGPASLYSLQNSGTVSTATLIEATRTP